MKIIFNPNSIYDRRILLIANMYNSGFSCEEIAKYLKLKLSTIEKHIETAKIYGYISNNNYPQKSDIPLNNTEADEKIINTFLQSHSNIFSNKNNSSNVTIEQIADNVKILGYQIQDINLLSRLYCNHNKFEEAINLLYHYESCHDLSPKEKEEIHIIKQHFRKLAIKHLLGTSPSCLEEK